MRKPQLNFAILCDNAFVDGGNKISIIQVFDNINTSTPAIYPRLTVVTNYSKERENSVPRSYKQVVSILGPSRKVIAKVEKEAEKSDGESFGFIIYFHSLTFAEKGKYDVEISLNGDKQGNVPFTIS